MENLGYYNGEYDLIENMKIPMLDRVCFFGDGCYDATYSHNHIIYQLDKHIDRFYNSADLLKIKIDKSKEEMKQLLCDMVNKVDDGDQFVYWQVTRGTAVRNHVYPDNNEVKSNIWIMLRPSKVQDTYKKIKLITTEDRRFEYCNIKTLNLLPSCMAAQKTAEAGCDESIFHRGNIVTECAHSNVSIIKDKTFITHPTDCYILPGIARHNLIAACKELGYKVKETEYTLDDLMDADEIIVSSSGSFCLAAESVNGNNVGGKSPEMLKKLQDFLNADFYNYCK